MKVSRGMTENALKGKFNGGSVTFGYIVDEDKHLQPDPAKALIVADIFRRYAGGESSKSILASLQEQGLKANHGVLPTYSFITALHKNRRYLGEYRFKDTIVENAFTPLVDADVFEKCQRRLAENQYRPASFKPVADKYLLTGRIFCGYCGGTMNGVSGTSSTGVTHRYNHCHTAKKHKTCEKKRVSKTFVENAVIDYILRMLDNAPLLNSIVDACYGLQLKQNTALPSLKQQLAQTKNEIDNIMSAIKQGIITLSTTETLLALEQDKEDLEINIAKAKMERPVLTKEQIKHWICRYRVIDLDDISQKQQLIDTFLLSVHVYDDKMLICLKHKDGEICVTFDEIKAAMEQKENADNHNDYQRSPLKVSGDPSATRTRDTLLKRQVLCRLS